MSRIQEIADDLNGTAQTLQECCLKFGIDEDDLTPEELAELDQHVVCCECCGWWDEAGAFDENQNCSDCGEGSNDD